MKAWNCSVPVNVTEAVRGLIDTEVFAALPRPVSAMVCRLLASVSLRVIDPVLVFVAVGVKVTLTVHCALGARDVPQVFVCAKSPIAEILRKVRVLLLALVTVTGMALLVVLIS